MKAPDIGIVKVALNKGDLDLSGQNSCLAVAQLTTRCFRSPGMGAINA